MARHEEENRFRKAFVTGASTILRNSICLKTEHVLGSALDLLKREVHETNPETGQRIKPKMIGRIDLLFIYRGRRYCGEIKYQPYAGNDFWDALKVMGYTQYLNWQNETYGDSVTYFPAVLMPENRIKLEHKITANKLKMMLFGITKLDNGNYRVVAVNEPD